ncbi:MAG: ABC transporter substrate-binding protein [Clostridia bacterium]|jgi:putative ABC transport system substrate-binding protein|nr:ABC transporter substrate-binding protein [Clostridiales bacterium]
MKRKQAMVVLTVLVAVLLLFTACSGNKTQKGINTGGSYKGETALKRIGIVQVVEHPSLSTIRESFVKGLEDRGFSEGDNIVIDYQNAQGEQANLKTICGRFANHRYDLIVAIATPSAQMAAGETSEIPVLFSACTDPIGSGLVDSMERPGKNVTGTSDLVSAKRIMELAQRITPGIRKVGALYNSGETNSAAVIADLREYAENNGMTLTEATVTNSSEIKQAAQSLAGKVDAIFLPIDNTVASAMSAVVQVAVEAKVPVYVGADSLVRDGGLATYGINYQALGDETADMAAEILKGTNAGDLPVRTIKDMEIYLNLATAEAIGITIPEDIINEAAEIIRE